MPVGSGRGEGGRTGVVVSGGYLRLSAKIVVLISMVVEEKIVVSSVWSLLTRHPTGQTDRPTHDQCVLRCPQNLLYRALVCGQMFVFVTKEKVLFRITNGTFMSKHVFVLPCNVKLYLCQLFSYSCIINDLLAYRLC